MAQNSVECDPNCKNNCPVKIAVKAAEDAMYTDPYIDESVKDLYVTSRGILSRRIIDSVSNGCGGAVDGECSRVEAFNAALSIYAEEIRPEIATIERGTDSLVRFTSLGSSAIDFSISKQVENDPNLARIIIDTISQHSNLTLVESDPEVD